MSSLPTDNNDEIIVWDCEIIIVRKGGQRNSSIINLMETTITVTYSHFHQPTPLGDTYQISNRHVTIKKTYLSRSVIHNGL